MRMHGVAAAIIAMGMVVGCGEDGPTTHTLTWSVSFATGAAEGQAARIRITILDGGCDGGETLFAEDLTPGAESVLPVFPEVPDGPVGIVAEAWDDRCQVFARTCENLQVPVDTDRHIDLVLLDGGTGPACAPTLCNEGRCDDEGDNRCGLQCSISGRIFDAADYEAGEGQPYDFGDRGMDKIRVELYSSGGEVLDDTETDERGRYSFSDLNIGKYTVRAVTPKADGLIPEQIFEANGTSNNGGAGALGGNDPLVDDTDTPAGKGPGDTNVVVEIAGRHVRGVDFGFSANVVTHTFESGQGSLRQFLINANGIPGPNRSQFAISNGNLLEIPKDPGADGEVFTIELASPLPTLTDNGTVIDGLTQTRLTGNTAASEIYDDAPEIVIQSKFSDPAMTIEGCEDCSVRGVWLVVPSAALRVKGSIRTTIERSILNGTTEGTTALADVSGGTDASFVFTEVRAAGNPVALSLSGSNHTIVGSNIFQIVEESENETVILNKCNRCSVRQSFVGFGVINGEAVGIAKKGLVLMDSVDFTVEESVMGGETALLWTNSTGVANDTSIIGTTGHRIEGDSSRVEVQGGRFFSSIFIDVGPEGADPNDVGDSDVGPNDLLNRPEVSSAIAGPEDTIVIQGTCPPLATLQFYGYDSKNFGFFSLTTHLGNIVDNGPENTDKTPGTIDATLIPRESADRIFVSATIDTPRGRVTSELTESVVVE
ncbi:MAG: hypothetical protein KC416_00195 [Myxococcales bacterium]|nr:hypothetical protein [Myxococcales bacterium]